MKKEIHIYKKKSNKVKKKILKEKIKKTLNGSSNVDVIYIDKKQKKKTQIKQTIKCA
jgi:hypothetical protein